MSTPNASPQPASHALGISRWLVEPATRALGPGALATGLAQRLIAAGVPLSRLSISVPTKHPELYVRNAHWTATGGAREFTRPHDIISSTSYTESPVAEIHRGSGTIRCRPTDEDTQRRYTLMRELAAQGATDYVIVPLVLSEGPPSFVSWATSRAEGFSDADVALADEVATPLAMWVELAGSRLAARNLLEVYLGRNAAERVHAGAFRRGTGVGLRAAIWFCDMRGFTDFTDRTPAADVVATLDRFFEHVAAPIEQHGGEVLKFVGDAVLAIFPLDAGAPADVCGRAFAAADDALAGITALNAQRAGAAPIALGIALHVGEVMYGNIGARNRLDFTVIGAAVNEVCRVESLCKGLGSPVLMTDAFAAALNRADVVSLGRHALKGVAAPREVFAPARFAR